MFMTWISGWGTHRSWFRASPTFMGQHEHPLPASFSLISNIVNFQIHIYIFIIFAFFTYIFLFNISFFCNIFCMFLFVCLFYFTCVPNEVFSCVILRFVPHSNSSKTSLGPYQRFLHWLLPLPVFGRKLFISIKFQNITRLWQENWSI